MQSNAARAGLLAALAAVAVVLFIVLSGGDDSDSDSETTASEPAATTGSAGGGPAEPVPEVFEVQLRAGAPVGGVAELDVTKGERVRLAVRSDEDAELHVHGYELEDELTAGGVTRLSFTADIDGKFEVEAHSHSSGDIPLAELTVQPE